MSKYSLSKKSGKRFCDELWGKLVRLEYNGKCPICISLNMNSDDVSMNPHHLISRRVFKYRWDTENGVLICPGHHEFYLDISAHTAPWGFEEWMKDHQPLKYAKWVENRKSLKEEQESTYEERYYRLEKQYKQMTGEYYMIKRIAMYLLSLDKTQIIMSHKMNGASVADLAVKYNVSEGVMKKFIATI